MSAAAIFTKTLSDSRRGLIGWAVGTALVGMVYASTYPSQRENVDSIPEALRQSLNVDGTAAGYLQNLRVRHHRSAPCDDLRRDHGGEGHRR